MPIYEYRCEQGHTFEVMQRMSDDPLSTCQTCEAPVARVFHPVAVHFKGSGFYNTDYGTRKRAREKAEAGEGGSAKAGESTTTSSSSDSSSSSSSSPSSDGASAKKSEGTSTSATAT
jgi:putative FmdB family regulatory protein